MTKTDIEDQTGSASNPTYDAAFEPITVQIKNNKTTNHSQVKLEGTNGNEAAHVVKINNSKPWQPYEDSKFDSPIVNRFLFPWPTYYKIRWTLLSVFHTRIGFGIVIGEILFLLLILGGLAGALAAAGGKLANPNAAGGDGDGEDGSTESTGSIAIIPPALAFAFACRNSIWIFLTGLPFERSLIWHKFFSYLTVIIGVWHGYISQEWDVTGTALTAVFVALPLFAMWPIRRRFFEAFYRLHWVLFVGVIALSVAHEAGAILFGVALWGVDILLRGVIIWLNRKRQHSVQCVRLPANVIRLTFLKRDFKYKSGQYCFLCIPQVSWVEWHPFSISSSPHENVVSIHIRVLGDWTKQLYNNVEETRNLNVYIDGPYGAPGIDVDGPRYKSFMFISGGIGITPMQSICNDVLQQHHRGRPVEKIMFIWSVRDLYMVNSVLEYDRKYYEENEPKQLPHSFSPDLLDRGADGGVLETYFHLTKERDSKKFQEANIHPELQPNLKFGRPDLSELFTRMKAGASSKGGSARVGVLACGPTALVNDAEKLCAKFSCNGITFDFHKEVFEF